MVFDLNAHTHKRISLMMLVFLLIVSTLSILSVQLGPVSAQTTEASLTGTITDRGEDTDEDGFFNFLNVGVEVNVSSAGTFRVEVVGLYDSEYSYINVSNQESVDLNVGIHVVQVSLSGGDI